MKPLHLELKAIGPFLERTVIPFDQIPSNGLFLISGPTGSGKSFIFDAMSFALFGKTGTGREKNMRSDFAEKDEVPEIIFTFSVRKQIFRVKRTLTYEKKFKTKDKWREVKEDQELVELSQWPDGKSTSMAQKLSDVNKALVEILGMNSDQFSQVILVPQGEFRRLLKGDDREKLLEQLFHSGLYKRIQFRLQDQLKDQLSAFKESRTRVEEKLQQAEHLFPEALVTEDVAVGLEEVGAALSHWQAMAPEAKDQRTKANKGYQKASENRKAAEALVQLFARQENLLKKKTALDLFDKGECVEIKNQLAAHRLASRLMPVLVDETKAKESLETAERSLEENKEALKRTRAEVAGCEEAGQKVATWEKQIHQAIGERERITSAKEDAIQCDAERAKIGKGTATLAKYQATLANAQKAQAELQQEAVSIEAALSKMQDAKENAPRLEQDVEEGARYLRLIQTIEADQQALKTEQKKLVAQRDEQKAASENVKAIRLRREQAAAGALAVELEDDQACPVCGSTHHPNPAAPVDAEASREQLEQAEEKLEQAGQVLREREKKVQGLRIRAEEQGGQAGAIRTRHADWSPDAKIFADVLSAMKGNAAEQKKAKQLFEKDSVRLESLRKNQLPQAADAEGKAEKAFADGKSSLSISRKRFEDLETRVLKVMPRDCTPGTGGGFTERLEELFLKVEKEEKLARKNMLSQQKAADETKTRLDQLLGQEGSLKSQRKACSARVVDTSAAVDKALGTTRFDDRDAAKAACQSEERVAESETRLKRHADELKENEVELRGVKQGLKGAALPDPEALEKVLVEARKVLDAAIREDEQLAGRLKNLNRLREEIDAIEKETGSKQEELDLLRRLETQARGKGKPKISLSRFFLSQRLEEVLIRATQRLSKLSDRQFEFRRRKDSLNLQSQAGLELNVIDNHTGTERPVHTLSGGEMFLASLSLALGLADVVQARSTDFAVDALFLDEGFGTLDDEALQMALEVLHSLREGRMVGIISHVHELKRQIPNRIEVSSSKVGSTARLVVES